MNEPELEREEIGLAQICHFSDGTFVVRVKPLSQTELGNLRRGKSLKENREYLSGLFKKEET